MVTERLDRHEQTEEERFNRLENDMLEIGKDIRDLRQDLNEHRNNTELHTAKKEKAS
jgi:predicted ATP-dependent endonuclease of OLD family